MQKKKGISLIVLVITIIVMIILAGSIVLTLSNSGIIDKASDAVIENDIANAKQIIAIAKSDWYFMNETDKEKYYNSFVEYAVAKLKEAGVADTIIARLKISEDGGVEVYPDLFKEVVIAASNTWYTGNTPKSTITTINIVNSASEEIKTTATESWSAAVDRDGEPGLDSEIMCYVNGTTLTIAGDGSGKIIANPNSSRMFSNNNKDNLFTNLTTINGAELLDTSNVLDMSFMFNYCESLKTVNVSTWDTRKVETMRVMFQKCSSLEKLDVSKWNTGNVTNMSAMFRECKILEELKVSNWNTENVTDMRQMFYSCTALTKLDVRGWNTSNVTDMSYIFAMCTAIEELDVSNWNTGNVTTMNSMFSGSDYGVNPIKIKTLDVSKWDTKNVIDMSFMFYACKGPGTIDVANWDVSKVENFDHMFAHSHLFLKGKEENNIDAVKKWNTSSATNMNAMFHSVGNFAIDVSSFDTSEVIAFSQMFEYMTNLTEIKGLEKFDTSKGITFLEMFGECRKLTELDLSSFDTSKATFNDITISANGGKALSTSGIFGGMTSLQKIKLGAKFTFSGDGTTKEGYSYGVLPTPTSGYWYDSSGESFEPTGIPNNTAATYWASEALIGT